MKLAATIFLLAALVLAYELGRLMGEQQALEQRTIQLLQQAEPRMPQGYF